MLEWDNLRVFLAIARNGSLTAAARVLGVTQPTMGRRLEELEERLAVRLFERTSTGAVLTEFGASILDEAERMEDAALTIERRLAGRDSGLEGLVNVTCVEWFGIHVLVPLFAAFSRQYAGVTVQVVADTRLFNLARHEAEIALRFTGFEQHGVVQRKVAELGSGLYASASYLERNGEPDFAAGCAGHCLITFHEDGPKPADAHWLQQVATKARIVFRSSSRDIQAHTALAGTGLVALPRCMGDALGGLRRLRPPLPGPRREVWLGYHEDLRETPRIRALARFLAEELKRQAPLLDPTEE